MIKQYLFKKLFFNNIVYPYIFEDPKTDLFALDLKKNAKVFTICSGGDNILNYLCAVPSIKIDAVDLNKSQIALTKIKIAAIKGSDTYNNFFSFIGKADETKNIKYYNDSIRIHLDNNEKLYWDKKKNISLFSKGIYNQGLANIIIKIVRSVFLSKNKNFLELVKHRSFKNKGEVINYYDKHIQPFMIKGIIPYLSNSPIMWQFLGIPPRQFQKFEEEALETGHVGKFSVMLNNRARNFIVSVMEDNNYFIDLILTGKYNLQQNILPDYLKEDNFPLLKSNLKNIRIINSSMHEHMSKCPDEYYNGFSLLDTQDWMNTEELKNLWKEIDRIAKPGAKVVFRTCGIQHSLSDVISDCDLNNWSYNDLLSKNLYLNDRIPLYGGFHVFAKK